jgi:hypothetical protein
MLSSLELPNCFAYRRFIVLGHATTTIGLKMHELSMVPDGYTTFIHSFVRVMMD